MSETDDTDDLLLIPPDFFSVGTQLETPYYNIVDSLITQVTNLQNRIESIESTSDLSLVGSYLDNSFGYSHNMNNSRKYSSSDDVYQSQSTQSTPQKPLTKPKLNSLPNTPYLHRFSPRNKLRSAQRFDRHTENEPVINEIDSFLSNVKTIQRINASRNLQKDFTNSDSQAIQPDLTYNNSRTVRQDFVNKNNDQCTNNVQTMSSIVENDYPQTHLSNNKEPIKEERGKYEEAHILKENTWRCGDDIQTVPNYGTGMRDILAAKTDKNFSKDSKQLNSSVEYGSSFVSNDKSDSSSDSTQLTAYNNVYKNDRNDLLHSPLHANALSVLHQHKKLLDNSAELKEIGVRKERILPKGIHTMSDNVGHLNLADIWASAGNNMYRDSSKLLQKLEEEKLRREHCETLIKELQTKNLELQQKLAVAVKVDQSKNNTIQQFKEALEKFAMKMEKNMKEKMNFESELGRITSQYKNELAEAKQKVAYYEKEVSKALNLAHANQEKMSMLEGKCAGLQDELQTTGRALKEFQDKYLNEFEKNKQLSDIISKKEIEMTENNSVINNARAEITQCKRAVDMCQAEVNSLKHECAKHQNEMREDKNLIITLNEQKRQLLNQVESHKSKEKTLHEELMKVKKQLESNKVELRNFYQGQVEILVQNKLKEFQNQLDKTESHCKEEIKKREMSIAKTAASHIQQISEKFALEHQLIETKHNEEIKLYQMQIMQQKQEIDNLQSKVSRMHDKRHHIARQLQKIMESQWNEALRIISNGKSPTFQEQQNFNTIDQLNTLRTRSYNNFEEVLSQHEFGNYDQPPGKKGDNNYGLGVENNSHDVNMMDTPVSSRPHKLSDNEIQKYVNMLLNKPPGNPTAEGIHEKQPQDNDRVSWQRHVRPRNPK